MIATPQELYRDSSTDTSALPVRTVDEVISEAGEKVAWIIENLLARGAVTEFSGSAKKGGKTTFWCHAIAAGARGEDHAGFATEPAKYLYLTEQGNNFAEALRSSGLEEHPYHLSIVQFKDVSAVGWERLIERAGAEAKRRNLDALIVDTFTVFARLKGSEENESGVIAERMRVLNLVAQRYNIGVVLIRHAGKDGTPRGSSAFEGVADICVTIARPEGRHGPTVRKRQEHNRTHARQGACVARRARRRRRKAANAPAWQTQSLLAGIQAARGLRWGFYQDASHAHGVWRGEIKWG
jgi:RecA-family ATPase